MGVFGDVRDKKANIRFVFYRRRYGIKSKDIYSLCVLLDWFVVIYGVGDNYRNYIALF